MRLIQKLFHHHLSKWQMMYVISSMVDQESELHYFQSTCSEVSTHSLERRPAEIHMRQTHSLSILFGASKHFKAKELHHTLIFSMLRAHPTTIIPNCARCLAIANPIPAELPVTRTTRSRKLAAI